MRTSAALLPRIELLFLAAMSRLLVVVMVAFLVPLALCGLRRGRVAVRLFVHFRLLAFRRAVRRIGTLQALKNAGFQLLFLDLFLSCSLHNDTHIRVLYSLAIAVEAESLAVISCVRTAHTTHKCEEHTEAEVGADLESGFFEEETEAAGAGAEAGVSFFEWLGELEPEEREEEAEADAELLEEELDESRCAPVSGERFAMGPEEERRCWRSERSSRSRSSR